jgi:hypothetical protein
MSTAKIASQISEPSSSRCAVPEPPSEVDNQDETTIDLWKDLAMSSSSSASSRGRNSVYDKTTIISRKQDQVSILTDGIIDPLPEYVVPDPKAAPVYNPTNKRELKAKELVSYQDEVVTLNIGGTAFMTTKPTLREEPSSILALLAPKLSSEPFFIDRPARHFQVILDYLRNGCQLSAINLPKDLQTLGELHCECLFYGIDSLEKTLEPYSKSSTSS